jgi:pyridoxamine 5'-phosphate oxidase
MEASTLDPDPFVEVGRWFDAVAAADPPFTEPEAMVLATAGADGRPRARNVLLKGLDRDGFVWFTNYESTKGRELAENPYGCLVFSWIPLRRQLIVTGPVSRLEPDESDAYFETRDRDSQIGAWASDQSEVIPDRAWLEARFEEFRARFPGPVPRPPHWGGYRLHPDAIELWMGRRSRLHDRFRYSTDPASPTGWRIDRLSP